MLLGGINAHAQLVARYLRNIPTRCNAAGYSVRGCLSSSGKYAPNRQQADNHGHSE